VSMRLEILQVARLSPRLLSEGTDLVRAFISSQLNDEGGFCDRAGNSDLYYTVFGLNCMEALQMEVPKTAVSGYLDRFGNGEGLDMIHLCALARCRAATGFEAAARDRLAARILAYRTPDGGFNVSPNAETATVYGNFMAMGAFQDLGLPLQNAEALADTCLAMRTGDGAFGNEPGLPMGNTPAVAAAESVLRGLGKPMPVEAGDWLLTCGYGAGGFFAVPGAPMPDLLSTATALHALSGLHLPLDKIREDCLDFIDSLWVNRGGFYGNWGDEYLDSEYTFYGLLALGHLSL